MTDRAATEAERLLYLHQFDGGDCIFINDDGGIGVSVGGSVVVMDIYGWHGLATASIKRDLAALEQRGHGELRRDADAPDRPQS